MLLLLVLLQAPQVLDRYECQGEHPQGKYEVSLTVVHEQDNYFLLWESHQAGIQTVQAKGFGIRTEDTFSAVYVTLNGQLGVIHYKVTAGRLEGVWAVGNGQMFVEVCSSGRRSSA